MIFKFLSSISYPNQWPNYRFDPGAKS